MIIENGFLLIAAFAAAHERVIEVLRGVMEAIAPRAPRLAWLLDRLTRGGGSVVPALVLSFATSANLLDVFRMLPGTDTPLFTSTFLDDWSPREPAWYGGCLLMAFAVTFGSVFWHDVAKGVMDVRERLKDLKDVRRLMPPPRSPLPMLLKDEG